MRGHEHKHGRPPPSGDSAAGPATARPGAAARTADRPCAECLDPSLAVAKPAWRLSRPVAFWLIAYAFAVTMLGTTLPTPLYVIYQAQWHFSTSLITLIFAAYALVVLAALLAAGRWSDRPGGRPVLAEAIGLSIASAATFILAPSVGWLFAGRALSGLSAGLMTGTATAALTETARPGSGRRASLVSTTANIGGLGLGPLLAGLLAQYAPRPTVMPAGLAVFLAALGLIVAGLAAASMPLFLAGTVVSGVAVGAVFMGSLAVANRLAPAETRSQVISTYFVFAYVGLTVPVIAVGFGSQAFGDFRATLGCAVALAAIALASMAIIRRSAA